MPALLFDACSAGAIDTQAYPDPVEDGLLAATVPAEALGAIEDARVFQVINA